MRVSNEPLELGKSDPWGYCQQPALIYSTEGNLAATACSGGICCACPCPVLGYYTVKCLWVFQFCVLAFGSLVWNLLQNSPICFYGFYWLTPNLPQLLLTFWWTLLACFPKPCRKINRGFRLFGCEHCQGLCLQERADRGCNSWLAGTGIQLHLLASGRLHRPLWNTASKNKRVKKHETKRSGIWKFPQNREVWKRHIGSLRGTHKRGGAV